MPRPSLASVAVLLLVSVLGLTAVAAVTRARGKQGGSTAAGATTPAAPAQAALRPVRPPAPAVTAEPAHPAVPKRAPAFAIERVRPGKQVALRAQPHGRVVAHVGSTTQFGSPQTFTVAARRGSWLGVTSTERPNGKLAWVDSRSGGLERHATHVAIQVDLSQRRLRLLDGRRVLRAMTVGIGRPGSPTPTGRYAITDKLAGSSYGAYYGCCILALSGHQTNTPAGWQGGNRLAIHGTNDPSSIGVPSSAGCLHARAADLKVLMRRVPLGTPVFIHR